MGTAVILAGALSTPGHLLDRHTCQPQALFDNHQGFDGFRFKLAWRRETVSRPPEKIYSTACGRGVTWAQGILVYLRRPWQPPNRFVLNAVNRITEAKIRRASEVELVDKERGRGGQLEAIGDTKKD
ncbi:hypothetical protein DFH09DRAFT_1076058 [Mycena vulgaris]|nr:hypothetical protein DFH09DRAFT_1096578 [Mycena vulgaris]KAJ6582883.1 hypothetical protein DFH09DRAFT_1076058 [Mycena vulgaris]